MADTKIKDLDAKTTVVASDELPINDSAGGDLDKKIGLDDTKTFMSLSPTLVTPALGTVASGVISACTSTSMVMVTPVLGIPTSGTLTNVTGLPPAGVVGTAAILGANTFTADQNFDGSDVNNIAFLQFKTFIELTISSGSVTATQTVHVIDTESNASSDDLDTIAGAPEGSLLIIFPISQARTTVVKDGADNIACAGDFSMDGTLDSMTINLVAGSYTELSRSDNGA